MYAKKQEKEIMTIYLQNQENLSFLLEKWAKCVVARVWWCVTTPKMFARTHFAHMFKSLFACTRTFATHPLYKIKDQNFDETFSVILGPCQIKRCAFGFNR